MRSPLRFVALPLSLSVTSLIFAACGARSTLDERETADAGSPDAPDTGVPDTGLPDVSPPPDVSMCKVDGESCASAGECCTGSCVEHVCSPPCKPDGAACSAPAECCAKDCQMGACGPACKVDGDACQAPGECCSGTCNAGHCGKLCVPDGFPCAPDAVCCTPGCAPNGLCGGCFLDGQGCMESSDCCSMICAGPICGGTDCPHDICKVGEKLTPMCGPCVAKICQADPFCCTSMWDQLCVFEVGSVCGQLCPTP